jgi:hypothetical protein
MFSKIHCNKICGIVCAASAILLPGLLKAQNNAGPTIAIPPGSGAYYQTNAGWLAMHGTLLMPFFQDTVRETFGLGHSAANVDLPGPSVTFRVTSPKPTFVVRGLSPDTGLYLVRETHKDDFRRLRMTASKEMSQWAHFRSKDLTAVDSEPLDSNVIRVRPHDDLKPGDYILVSGLESRFRAFLVGFEFHVTGSGAGS